MNSGIWQNKLYTPNKDIDPNMV